MYIIFITVSQTKHEQSISCIEDDATIQFATLVIVIRGDHILRQTPGARVERHSDVRWYTSVAAYLVFVTLSEL
jgi:hypothetical protein